MRRRILLLIVSLTFISGSLVNAAHAASPSPTNRSRATPEASTDSNSNKVQELKEKLATKVAELRESQKRGFYGTVAALSKSAFTLVTKNGEIRIRIGEDTLIYDADNKNEEKTLADVSNTQLGAVLGFYDENEEQQHAKILLLQKLPTHYYGEVEKVDRSKGTLTLKTQEGSHVFDYERTTQSDEYVPAENKTNKSGLSRIAIGDKTHIWGQPTEGETIQALRVFRIPKEIVKESILGTQTTTSASAEPKEKIESPKPSPRARISPRATARTSPKAPRPTPEE